MNEQRFTPETRLAIVQAHVADHDGVYKPDEFVASASDPSHPAHQWFVWDDSKAAHSHRIWQARQFIKIRIKVPQSEQTVVSNGEYKIEIKEMPAFISPMDTRMHDGGFVPTTPDEFRRQALQDGYGLIAWLRRYGVALSEDEISTARDLIRSLEFPKGEAAKPVIVVEQPAANGADALTA